VQFFITLVLLMLGAVVGTAGADDVPSERPRVHVQAMPTHTHVEPGGSTSVAVRFTIPSGWHIYWADSGDAGVPTQVEIKAPRGVNVGPVTYSRPITIADPAGTVNGYERTALLLVPMTLLADGVSCGWVDLTIEANWLVCRRVCYLGSKKMQVRVKVDRGVGLETAAADWVRSMSMPGPVADRLGTTLRLESERMVIEGPIGDSGPPAFLPIHVPGVELGLVTISRDGGQFAVTVPYHLRPSDSLGRTPRIQGLLTFGRRSVDPCWSISRAIPIPSPPMEGDHQ